MQKEKREITYKRLNKSVIISFHVESASQVNCWQTNRVTIKHYTRPELNFSSKCIFLSISSSPSKNLSLVGVEGSSNRKGSASSGMGEGNSSSGEERRFDVIPLKRAWVWRVLRGGVEATVGVLGNRLLRRKGRGEWVKYSPRLLRFRRDFL